MLSRSKRVTYNRLNPKDRVDGFVKFLNSGNYSKKLGKVLDSISEINENRGKWEKKIRNAQGEIIGAHILTDRKSALESEISAALSRVKLFPSLGHRLGWRTGYRYAGPEAGRRDSVLVRHLLDAASTGLLDRVQKCTCGLWFHRRVEDQRFHSPKCREKAFKSTEKWKAYRRTKAREYYRLHMSGKVK